MPKFFVSNNQIKNDASIEITGTDLNHIKNVLRKNILDKLVICDKDSGQDYLCEITEIGEKIKCKIIDKIKENTESNIYVSIYQGLPKADKMELIIQKSVELGVYDITPIEMKRCIVKIKENDKNKKIERWQKIAEVAAKQSGRNHIPVINNIININQICKNIKSYDIVFVAYENEKENTLKEQLKILKEKEAVDLKIAVIIGPEGGIDEKEIETLKENGAKIITLGKRILRTETVALNVLSNIMYELGD